MPYDRLQEYFNDCFGLNISDGVLVGSNKRCFEHIAETEQALQLAMTGNPIRFLLKKLNSNKLFIAGFRIFNFAKV